MKIHNFTLALLFAIAGWTSPASAKPFCSALFRPHPQIAKEIEIYSTARLLSFLDTKDGLLLTPVPEQSRAAIKERFGAHVETMTWKNASDEERKAVIEAIAPTVDFAQDRQIPGFHAPESLRLTPYRDFVFRGQSFQKGVPATVDLRGFLFPLVEYAGGGFVAQAGAVEFHFRGQSPAKLDEDVRTFFRTVLHCAESNAGDGLSQPSSDHLHVVAEKPQLFVEKLRSRGISDRAIVRSLTSYHSLVELAMIFASRTGGERNLTERKSNERSPPLFSYLKRERIGELVKFYSAVVDGKNLDINKYSESGTALKKNLAGARWGSAYSDQNLWGIELRFPTDATSTAAIPLSEGVKRTLDAQDFRISQAQAKQMDRMTEEEFASALWFSTSAEENAEAIRNPETKKLAKVALAKVGVSSLKAQYDNFSYVSHKTLAFFDWASHPLMTTRPGSRARIEKAQSQLFQKVVSAGELSDSALDEFFKDSGLQEYVNYVVARIPN